MVLTRRFWFVWGLESLLMTDLQTGSKCPENNSPLARWEDESESKTFRFGHVSGDFESGIESGNFESENVWIKKVLTCKRFSLECGYFSRQRYFEFAVQLEWQIQQSKGIQSGSRIDGHWWLSLVASSFCHRLGQSQAFKLHWVILMLYSSETKKATQTMLTSSTLYRKWRWHDRKSGWFWMRPGQMPGGTTWWATKASVKKTSDCLNLPLGIFLAAYCFSLSRQQTAS